MERKGVVTVPESRELETESLQNKPSTKINFYLEPSEKFMKEVEQNGGDPRAAIAVRTNKESQKRGGGWTPAWDAKDSR